MREKKFRGTVEYHERQKRIQGGKGDFAGARRHAEIARELREKPKAIIFDMDGTLCNVSSIRHHLIPTDPKFAGKKNFDAFHAESVNCPPHEDVTTAFHIYKDYGYKVIVVTARQEKYRAHTSWWLSEQGLHPDEHHHRPNGDFRKDVEIKREILADLRKRYDIVQAWDDNPAIIELWQSEGIDTRIVPGWEYE